MNIEPFNNLEDLLINSVELANKIGVNEQTEILPLQKRKIMKQFGRLRYSDTLNR